MLFPTDVDHDPYECDEECSEESDISFSTTSWYSHVLPQLRDKKWFGRKIVETIQVLRVPQDDDIIIIIIIIINTNTTNTNTTNTNTTNTNTTTNTNNSNNNNDVMMMMMMMITITFCSST